MNSAAIRHTIKRVLPSPVVRTLARVRQYLHRISAWARVMSELKGRTGADSRHTMAFVRSLSIGSVL